MTKEQFLARCETIHKLGLARPELFVLMRQWLDALMRYEHTMFSHGQSQGRDWIRFLNDENERIEKNGGRTLAGDKDGYALQEIAAILCHPCQRCAENINAWHTRTGFCDHKQDNL